MEDPSPNFASREPKSEYPRPRFSDPRKEAAVFDGQGQDCVHSVVKPRSLDSLPKGFWLLEAALDPFLSHAIALNLNCFNHQSFRKVIIICFSMLSTEPTSHDHGCEPQLSLLQSVQVANKQACNKDAWWRWRALRSSKYDHSNFPSLLSDSWYCCTSVGYLRLSLIVQYSCSEGNMLPKTVHIFLLLTCCISAVNAASDWVPVRNNS